VRSVAWDANSFSRWTYPLLELHYGAHRGALRELRTNIQRQELRFSTSIQLQISIRRAFGK